jgi:selenide,water dikinase
MVASGEIGFKLNWNKIPRMDGVQKWAEAGLVPGGAYSNREYRENMLDVDMALDDWMFDVLFDPQTSGGLLIAAPQTIALVMVNRIRDRGFPKAAIIGEVVAEPKGRIIITE